MIRAYDEIIDFIASGTTPAEVAGFEASSEVKSHVAELIAKEKTDGLSAAEESELEHYVQLEHLMRLAKARARRRLADDQLHSD